MLLKKSLEQSVRGWIWLGLAATIAVILLYQFLFKQEKKAAQVLPMNYYIQKGYCFFPPDIVPHIGFPEQPAEDTDRYV